MMTIKLSISHEEIDNLNRPTIIFKSETRDHFLRFPKIISKDLSYILRELLCYSLS
jgi:hypothetical protein